MVTVRILTTNQEEIVDGATTSRKTTVLKAVVPMIPGDNFFVHDSILHESTRKSTFLEKSEERKNHGR